MEFDVIEKVYGWTLDLPECLPSPLRLPPCFLCGTNMEPPRDAVLTSLGYMSHCLNS